MNLSHYIKARFPTLQAGARTLTSPYFSLVLTLVLTISFAWFAHRNEQLKDVAKLEAHVVQVKDILERRIQSSVEAALHTAGLFQSSESVTRSEFRIFSKSILSAVPGKGLESVSFVERVSAGELAEHQEKVRREGAIAYQVWPAGPREEYFPVVYIEPFDAVNRRALGFDIGSEAKRLATLTRARDTGQVLFTPPLKLVQSTGNEQEDLAYLICVPIFRNGSPTGNVEERRNALVGFVTSPVHAHTFFGQILEEIPPAIGSISLVDLGPGEQSSPIFQSVGAQGKSNLLRDDLYSRSVEVSSAGRTWKLRFVARPEDSHGGFLVGIVFLSGSTISMLLFIINRNANRMRNEAERVAAYEKFSSDSGNLLSASLDLHTTLENIVQLCVNEISDWCSVRLAMPDGHLRLVAARHREKELTDVLWEIERRFGILEDKTQGPSRVHSTGVSQLEVFLPDKEVVRYMKDDEHHRLWQQVGLTGYMCVPLKARGRSLGTLSLGAKRRYEIFGEIGLRRVESLAQKFALAIENSRLVEELQYASRSKDHFIAMVSHELRTPLSAIVGWVDLLKRDKQDSSTLKEALESIERNAVLGEQQINDLLDISRITEGKLVLDFQDVNLVEIVNNAVSSVRFVGEKKGIELKTHFGQERCLVHGDKHRLTQLVLNLLNNALKFTDRGGEILVSVVCSETHVHLRVADTGRGIDPHFLPHVFERYKQQTTGPTATREGLGLGLAIVKQICELHGGRVKAESAGLNMGSQFEAVLPRLKVSATADKRNLNDGGYVAAPPERVTNSLRNTQILVVEDAPDLRRIFTVMLKQNGANVTAVDSAGEALKALEQSKFDLIVSDIGLPVTSGYDLLTIVRSSPSNPNRDIPAIALTGFASSEDQEKSRLAGFQKHLRKPVVTKEFVEVVADLLGRRHLPSP